MNETNSMGYGKSRGWRRFCKASSALREASFAVLNKLNGGCEVSFQRSQYLRNACEVLTSCFEAACCLLLLFEPNGKLLEEADLGDAPLKERFLDMLRSGKVPGCVKALLTEHTSKYKPSEYGPCAECPERENCLKSALFLGALEVRGGLKLLARFSFREEISEEVEAQVWELLREICLVLSFLFREEENLRLTQALRDSEERYRVIFELASDPIFCVDREGRFRAANAAAARALDMRPEEVVGKHMKELFPPEVADRQLRNIEKVFETKRPLMDAESPTVLPSGVRHFSTNLSPIFGENGEVNLVLGVARDLTEIKESQKRERLLAEELSQSQKMEAMGRLASAVAHDFNNILTAIKGYAQLLEIQLPEGSAEKEHAREIVKAADQASALTRQLLDFARKKPLQLGLYNLNDVIKDNQGIIKQLVGEKVELVLDLAPNLPAVKVDPDRIARVLLNLAANSRDAMPEGGRLRFATCLEQVSEDRSGLPAGKYVRLSVSDTGCGMDAETVKHIFEPFFTTKGEGKGTGLGLSIVYSVVKQHGGYMLVETQLGKGTTFHLYFPQPSECVREEELSSTDFEKLKK